MDIQMFTTHIRIDHLRAYPGLWFSFHLLIYDLRHMRFSRASNARINNIVEPLYIGAPYFFPDEVEMIKLLHMASKTHRCSFEKHLINIGYRELKAEDLAREFEEAFQIDAEAMAEDVDFLERVRTRGLNGGKDWTGLKEVPGSKAAQPSWTQKSLLVSCKCKWDHQKPVEELDGKYDAWAEDDEEVTSANFG